MFNKKSIFRQHTLKCWPSVHVQNLKTLWGLKQKQERNNFNSFWDGKAKQNKKYQIVNVGDFNACICLSTHPNNFDHKNVFNNNNDDSKTNAKLKSIHCLLLSVIMKRNKKTYALLWFFLVIRKKSLLN
jgi:hypothetical protein